MDPFVIAAVLSGLILLVLTIAFLRITSGKDNVASRTGKEAVVNRPATGNQRARMRANAARQHVQEDAPENDQGEGDEDQAEATTSQVEFHDNMGAKKRAKLEAKQEKKKQREAEEQMRMERKRKEEIMEEERKKVEAMEEEEERQREEAERKAEEDRKRKEQAEYDAMKAAFTVEGEGFDEEDDEQKEHRLKDFVDYIKNQKVVVLEDLAAHYKLKTQAVIDRITDLQASGELTGVIDDRGKFIFISVKELEDVAKFIRQRGRVSITDLAESSNNLINLNPVTAS